MPTCANHPDIIEGLASCSRCGGSFCSNCIITLQGRTVCAGCKTERVKDIVSGVPVGLDLATTRTRLSAFVLDAIIIWLVFMTLAFLSVFLKPILGDSIGGVLVIAFFVSPMIYEALMLQYFGQTLGKKVAGIAVVASDGTPLKPARCWYRAAVRYLLQITQIGGLIDALMIFGQNRLTLHDRAARSRVVNRKRH